MKVPSGVRSVQLFLISCLVASAAPAAPYAPAPGLYENSSGAPIVALLDSARKFIDIEIYQMSDPLVLKAILNAMKDGVKVRILQEPTPVGDACKIFESPDKSTDDDRCLKLKAFRDEVVGKGGTYLPFNKKLCGGATSGCVQHGKMIIVDAKAALLSSGNFNSSNLCNKNENPSRCNRDYSYITHDHAAIQALGQIFEKDLKGKPYDLKAILGRSGARDLSVSPYSLPVIGEFIRSAKSSLIIQNQYLKDPKLNELLIQAAKRGVKVRINVASVCAFGRPDEAEGKRWKDTYAKFEGAGIQVRAFTSKIPVGGRNGYLHSKAIVVDGKAAWVGSVNGSTQSLGSNREFGMFFAAQRDVSRLYGFMDKDFRHPGAVTWQEALQCKNDKADQPDAR